VPLRSRRCIFRDGCAVKRLQDKYCWTRWPPDSDWVGEKAQWQSLGVDPGEVLRILKNASMARVYYEDLLEVRSDLPALRKLFASNARTFQRVVRNLEPSIELMKRRIDLFGTLGLHIERRLENLRDILAEANREDIRIPRHRPGTPWLEVPVLRLAALFRKRRRSTNQTIALIHQAFVKAGHQDHVTRDRIRHILRRHTADQHR